MGLSLKRQINLRPVGSIYMSIVNTNPSVYFGGTWTVINDSYFKAVTSDAGQYSGNDTITIDQMPAHTHKMWDAGYGQGNANYSYGDSYRDKIASPGYSTGETGGDQPYYPWYYGVYAWIRTA